MSDGRPGLWAKLAGYQATWIADSGLKTRLVQAIGDAGDGISDHDLAARLDSDPKHVQLWCRSAYAAHHHRDPRHSRRRPRPRRHPP